MKFLKKKKSVVCDMINILNNIVLNFMAKISDELFEKCKHKDITKVNGLKKIVSFLFCSFFFSFFHLQGAVIVSVFMYLSPLHSAFAFYRGTASVSITMLISSTAHYLQPMIS